MTPAKLTLSLLDGSFAVCRFDVSQAVQPWMLAGDFCSLTRTADELSLVLAEESVPQCVTSEGGWRCMKIVGPLDFSLIGILAGLSGLLAEAGVSLFAISTYDTDYILVKDDCLADALAALRTGGHTIT